MRLGTRGTGIAMVLAAAIFSVGPAFAQAEGSGAHHLPKEKPAAEEGARREGMMGQGMMGGMMGPMMGGGMMKGMMGHRGMMAMEERCMMHMERMMGAHLSLCIRNAEKLGISDEQLERLRAVHDSHAKKWIRLRSEIQILNVDLRSELAKTAPDLSRVESLLKKREPVRTELFLEGLKTRSEASKILTEEQRKRLHKMMMEGMTMEEEEDGS